MTGSDFARKLVGRGNVHLSNHTDRYDPVTAKVYLSFDTSKGTGYEALMNASHECAHRMLHKRWPWTRHRTWRMFSPALVMIEWKAWAMAYQMTAPNLGAIEKRLAWRMRWKALTNL